MVTRDTEDVARLGQADRGRGWRGEPLRSAMALELGLAEDRDTVRPSKACIGRGGHRSKVPRAGVCTS